MGRVLTSVIRGWYGWVGEMGEVFRQKKPVD